MRTDSSLLTAPLLSLHKLVWACVLLCERSHSGAVRVCSVLASLMPCRCCCNSAMLLEKRKKPQNCANLSERHTRLTTQVVLPPAVIAAVRPRKKQTYTVNGQNTLEKKKGIKMCSTTFDADVQTILAPTVVRGDYTTAQQLTFQLCRISVVGWCQ